MKKIMPIIIIIASIIGIAISCYGLALAITSNFTQLLSPFAIVAIIIGFTVSAICASISFIFSKSKLCIAGGIISVISVIIAIIAFIILL